MVAYIIMALIAYFIGSISFSVIISKKIAGFDVREKGSGNAGSTNVLRTVGKKAALLTLICDISKGIVAVLISLLIGVIAKNSNKAILVEIAALFVVIGHTYPIFFGFKGGKGVATSLGLILIINWKIGLICLIFALSLMAITRMVSLGSISAAILFAILVIFFRDNSYIVEYNATFILFGILLAGLVIINHRTNLKRIIAGTENRLSFKKTGNNDEKKEVVIEEKVEEKTEVKEEKKDDAIEEKNDDTPTVKENEKDKQENNIDDIIISSEKGKNIINNNK